MGKTEFQLLPLNENELSDIKFYNKIKVYNNGKKWLYKKKGPTITNGSEKYILFQYHSHVIAFGKLKSKVKEKIEYNGENYYGYLIFENNSIKQLSDPVEKNALKKQIKNFKNFNQTFQKLKPKSNKKFLEFLKIREIDETDTEFFKDAIQDALASQDASNPEYTKNNSIRLKTDVNLVIKRMKESNFCCEYDNNHKSFVSKKTQKRYTEVHHLIPRNQSINFKKSVDFYENLFCLCPICHLIIHKGKDKEARKIIEKLYKNFLKRINDIKKIKKDYEVFEISVNEMLKMYKIT
ncbi:MAG TPA: HNH endonuclease [Ignavibacteria bacterium]|nr:HNH endonuclease [Ignavibacteria bacterium]